MKSFAGIALLTVTFASTAHAENVANNKLPFKFEVSKVEAVERSGTFQTVVTIKIENGEYSLPTATFHCEAKSDKGNTWDVEGVVKNVDPKESRSVRLVSQGDNTGEFSSARSVNCEVKAFDGGLR